MSEKQNQQKETILRISGVNPKKCMKCGKCSGACPAFDQMEYHPHQFVAMVEKGNLEPLLHSKSLYYCLSCLACIERCPRGVEPAKLVEAVRDMQLRTQGGDHIHADDIPCVWNPDMPQQALVSAFRKYSK